MSILFVPRYQTFNGKRHRLLHDYDLDVSEESPSTLERAYRARLTSKFGSDIQFVRTHQIYGMGNNSLRAYILDE